uniref:Uncharacterized protein n=1 Tax=Parascaris equorum TaxID=6256 RepID=A0A914RCH0_PAREQ
MPLESFFWPGGKLQQDRGVVIYDVNHLKPFWKSVFELSSK